MEIRPVAGGSGEEEEQGHEIDPNDLIRRSLEEKGEQGQESGDEGKGKTSPAPAKPAPAAPPKQDVAWFLAKRDVKKSCPALDDDDIEVLEAAASGDPVRFVELAEKQQAKREALVASRPKTEDEQAALEQRAAREIFGGGGPGGSGDARPKEPTPAEKVKTAVEKGDSRGVLKGMSEVINKGGKDGKPMFDGVRIGPE